MFEEIFSFRKKEEKEKIEILVDFREKNSLVPSFLIKENFDVSFKQLSVGDYIVNGVVLERKTILDLKNSIVDKRIISQLLALKQYDRKILIIEGYFENTKYAGGIHENAVRGFLLSVALDYEVPVIFTKDAEDTAKYISVLAKKKKKENVSLRESKVILDDYSRAKFILEGFANIGPKKAEKLIKEFGSLKRVFNSDSKQLSLVLGKRASDFLDLVEKDFENSRN